MPAKAGCCAARERRDRAVVDRRRGLEAEVEAALELLALAAVLDVGEALERLHPAQRLAVDAARLRARRAGGPCRFRGGGTCPCRSVSFGNGSGLRRLALGGGTPGAAAAAAAGAAAGTAAPPSSKRRSGRCVRKYARPRRPNAAIPIRKA